MMPWHETSESSRQTAFEVNACERSLATSSFISCTLLSFSGSSTSVCATKSSNEMPFVAPAPLLSSAATAGVSAVARSSSNFSNESGRMIARAFIRAEPLFRTLPTASAVGMQRRINAELRKSWRHSLTRDAELRMSGNSRAGPAMSAPQAIFARQELTVVKTHRYRSGRSSCARSAKSMLSSLSWSMASCCSVPAECRASTASEWRHSGKSSRDSSTSLSLSGGGSLLKAMPSFSEALLLRKR
mmetsp:Transcript_143616/g.459458  ORF Transcript_143616/g.459458 Transcript_143616/m.459458 type:complete len:244 (+) Transcript_143616:2511-3242(+)